MNVSVKKDKKGSAFVVQHVRCGYHECIWLTVDELKELKMLLDELV